MTETLQQKIDAILDTEFTIDQWAAARKALQEFRDDIDNLGVHGAHSPAYYEGFSAACDLIQLMIGAKCKQPRQ